MNLTVPAAAFQLQQGVLKTVSVSHIDEGFKVTTVFCEACGTTIYALAPGPDPPTVVFIQVGTLDDAAPLESTPEKELNIKYRPDWVKEVKEAAQCRTYVP